MFRRQATDLSAQNKYRHHFYGVMFFAALLDLYRSRRTRAFFHMCSLHFGVLLIYEIQNRSGLTHCLNDEGHYFHKMHSTYVDDIFFGRDHAKYISLPFQMPII